MRVALVSAVVFAGLVLAGSAVSGERTASSAQVYFDQATGELVRRTVSVIDPLPELNRDFSWAPASGVPGTGLLTGSGTLTWRIAGSADFDRAAVHTVYAGAMAGGRPHGPGRLTTRDGLLLEGNFADGHLEGTGTRIDPNGDRYDGGFAAGLASGQGRLLYANGDLFEGRFVAGRRHGPGTLRLAGGGVMAGPWIADRFAGLAPHPLEDALVGGVVKTAGAKGDAARVSFGVTVDRRMTAADGAVRYVAEPADNGLVIRPETPTIWERWTGRQPIRIEPYWLDYDTDWDLSNSHVWLKGEVTSTDGQPFTIESLSVDVKASSVFRKPLFAIDGEFGCTSYRPGFSLFNSGFGKAYDATLTYAFTSRDGSRRSASFQQDLGTIDQGVHVDLSKAIAGLAGGDDWLATTRFVCNGDPACQADPAPHMKIGAMAPFAFASRDLDIRFGPAGALTDRHVVTRVDGTISYQWRGDGGTTFTAAEPLEAFVSLGTIDPFEKVAECGAGFGGSPEAPNHQPVALKESGRDYSVTLPVRGKKTKTSHTVLIDLTAPRSSVHDIVVRIRFADGSTRSARPLFVKYFRIPEEAIIGPPPAADGGACYLEDYTAC